MLLNNSFFSNEIKSKIHGYHMDHRKFHIEVLSFIHSHQSQSFLSHLNSYPLKKEAD
jgi:hypothetical protein